MPDSQGASYKGWPLMAKTPGSSAPPLRRAPIAELVGPAGAGKSSVLRALRERGVNGVVRIRDKVPWPHIVASAATLQPLFWGLLRRAPTSLRESAIHLVRLQTMRPAVERLAAAGAPLVLDEGPVFLIARLMVHLDPTVRYGRLDRFCQDATAFWALKLDTIIWLDAPDSVLVRRIRQREKRHALKHDSEAAMVEFLQSYRRAYDRIFSKLLATGGVGTMTFDTAEMQPDTVAERVVMALEGRDA